MPNYYVNDNPQDNGDHEVHEEGCSWLDQKKYGGNYIATESFNSNDVVSFGKDPIAVYNDAQEKGISDPVINYLPEEGVICIY
jgi:hypothetical protein